MAPVEVKARLNKYRREIDRIDLDVLALLNRRAKLAEEIGKAKREAGLKLYAPEREQEVLSRLESSNPGPLAPGSVQAIFREIMSACLALQTPLRVAYLGPEATFSHLASMAHFGSSSCFLAQPTISQVFCEVEKGLSDFGVVPVENSTEGAVSHTLDILIESDLRVVGEVVHEVCLSLLGKGGDISRLNKIYSHPQALAQCRHWLDTNLPKVSLVEVESTALAARVANQQKGAAAVASEYAGKLYGLVPLRRKIQDNAVNVTRFLVIGKNSPGPTGRDKTSLVFSVEDKVGALKRMLEPFARRRINLTKIESRPLKGKAWEYLFFLDLEGHMADRKVDAAIQELRKSCLSLKVLGSYPKSPSGSTN